MECFIVLIYKGAASANTIREVCHELFVKHERELKTILLPSVALPEREFYAICIAGYV